MPTITQWVPVDPRQIEETEVFQEWFNGKQAKCCGGGSGTPVRSLAMTRVFKEAKPECRRRMDTRRIRYLLWRSHFRRKLKRQLSIIGNPAAANNKQSGNQLRQRSQSSHQSSFCHSVRLVLAHSRFFHHGSPEK